MKDGVHSEEKKVQRAFGGEGINPQRYGMIFCSNCSGSGRYFYGNTGASFCHTCGGSGLIRIERNHPQEAPEMVLSAQ